MLKVVYSTKRACTRALAIFHATFWPISVDRRRQQARIRAQRCGETHGDQRREADAAREVLKSPERE